jgi:hypothetical protein
VPAVLVVAQHHDVAIVQLVDLFAFRAGSRANREEPVTLGIQPLNFSPVRTGVHGRLAGERDGHALRVLSVQRLRLQGENQ